MTRTEKISACTIAAAIAHGLKAPSAVSLLEAAEALVDGREKEGNTLDRAIAACHEADAIADERYWSATFAGRVPGHVAQVDREAISVPAWDAIRAIVEARV